MSVWLITAVAALALLGLITAQNVAARRSRRRLPRRRVGDEPGASGLRDEIDEYWGNALPANARDWADEGAAAATLAKLEPRAEPVVPVVHVSPAEVAVGDAACRLGVAFLRFLTEQNHLLASDRGPDAARRLRLSLEAFERRAPSKTLPHGAVAHRVAPGHVLLCEPLTEVVRNADSVLDVVADWVGDAAVTLVLGDEELAPAGATAHVGALVRRFDVAAHQLFALQEDGSFHTHLETERHFVPSRIDAMAMPEAFFDAMFGYAQERFDAGEPEASLRTLGPLAGPLWQRVVDRRDFDGSLLARALNLLGAANRASGCDREAVACFESALVLLKSQEDYDAVQIVEANLGMALLQLGRSVPDALKRSTTHLQAAVRLGPNDVVTWRTLGDAFVTRFETERSGSLLVRAEHAYAQAQSLRPDTATGAALERLEKLKMLRRSAELSAVRPTRKPGEARAEEPQVGVAKRTPGEVLKAG